ncbi:MAG: DUF3363 domain-containing protein, partial [Myxococcota bacterium]
MTTYTGAHMPAVSYRTAYEEEETKDLRGPLFPRTDGGRPYRKSRRRSYVPGARGAIVGEPPGDYQRVIVKARYQDLSSEVGRSKARAHMRYLGRDGQALTSEEKGRAFFGARDERDPDAFCSDLQIRQWRFIVSPEEGERLDLRAYGRKVMAQMEDDLGVGLDWIAIDHYGSGTPHLHIVVNGVDSRGRELRITPDYISRGLRFRAQRIATHELGLRKRSIAQQYVKGLVREDRYNAADRALERQGQEVESPEGHRPDLLLDMRPASFFVKRAAERLNPAARYADTGGHVMLAEDQSFSRRARLQRLHHLAEYGLAWEVERGVWKIDGYWKQTLALLARQSDLTDTYELHGLDVGPDAFEPLDPGESFTGEVVDVGLADESRDRYYVLLRSPDGAHYWGDIGAISPDERPEIGERITLQRDPEKVIRFRKSHENLLKFAEDGVYSLYEHLEWAAETLPMGDDALDSYVESHRQALLELAEHDLAQPLGDGLWEIDDDLEARIDQLNLEAHDGRTLPGAQARPYHIDRHGRLWDQVRAMESVELDDYLRGHDLSSALIAEASLDPYEKVLRARVRRLESFGLATFDTLTGRVEVADVECVDRELAVRSRIEQRADRRSQVEIGLDAGEDIIGLVVDRMRVDGQRYLVCAAHDGRLVCVDDYLQQEAVADGDVIGVTVSSTGYIEVDTDGMPAIDHCGLTAVDRLVSGELSLGERSPQRLHELVEERAAFLHDRGLMLAGYRQQPEVLYADLLGLERGQPAPDMTHIDPMEDTEVIGELLGRVPGQDGRTLAVIDAHNGQRYLVGDFGRDESPDAGDYVTLSVSTREGAAPFVDVERYEVDPVALRDGQSPSILNRFVADDASERATGSVAALLTQRARALQEAARSQRDLDREPDQPDPDQPEAEAEAPGIQPYDHLLLSGHDDASHAPKMRTLMEKRRA